MNSNNLSYSPNGHWRSHKRVRSAGAEPTHQKTTDIRQLPSLFTPTVAVSAIAVIRMEERLTATGSNEYFQTPRYEQPRDAESRLQ